VVFLLAADRLAVVVERVPMNSISSAYLGVDSAAASVIACRKEFTRCKAWVLRCCHGDDGPAIDAARAALRCAGVNLDIARRHQMSVARLVDGLRPGGE
jgi:hypothetical protein